MVHEVFSIALGHPEALETPASQGPSRSVCALGAYIASHENALAAVAADSVLAGDPAYNPIVFCGPSMTGKTLLARGLALRQRILQPAARQMVTSGAEFARAYRSAADSDGLMDFRRRCRLVDFFVLDNVQELSGKEDPQHDLTRTLDLLVARQRQVIVTARRPPDQLQNLTRRLCSRLSQGLVVPLEVPGTPARRVILQQLAELHQVGIEPAALDLLAADQHQGTPAPFRSVPQLTHALVTLQHQRQALGSPITTDEVARLLAQQAGTRPALRSICGTVSHHYGVSVGELRGPTRKRHIVQARAMAMYVARRLTNSSLQEIGQHFCGRDHSTVLHACRKIELLIEEDPNVQQLVQELVEIITGG